MNNLYENFSNLYPVSKTLRFELKPIGKTLENIEKNGIITRDLKRAEEYKCLKKILDIYYKKFIEDALSDVVLEGLEEYEKIYNKGNKSDQEKEELIKIQDSLRKQIVEFLNTPDEYKKLFKKDIIKEEAYKVIETEEDTLVVKSFDKFSSMCTGFFENRKNIFSVDEKSTAVGYRVINENLPKFINNKKVFEKQISIYLENQFDEINGTLCNTIGANNIQEVFDINYFNNTLSQNGIDKYNQIIGGFVDADGKKIKGLNEYINLYNQVNKNSKIARLQPLYKQILSDRETLSFIPDKFETDNDLLETVRCLYNTYYKDICDEDTGMFKTILNIEQYELDGIYVENNTDLTKLSRLVFDDWRHIKSCIKDWYDLSEIGKQKNREKYEEARDKYIKNIKSFSIEFITDITNADICKKIVKILNEYKTEVENNYIFAKELLNTKYPENRKLINDKDNVALIKNLLGSMKALEKFIKIFAGTGLESNRDNVFYGDIEKSHETFKELTTIYNKTRNYLTQKLYSTEKIKLTFNAPTLLNGWDLNKESDNKGVIFEKEGNYYLGIMSKDGNKIFANLEESKDESCYKKMEYKLLPGVNKMLPKVFFAKSNIEYYAPSEDILSKYKKGTHKKGKDFNLEDCHALIDFFKESIAKHPDWSKFGFEFSETKDYPDISYFYREVENQGYKVAFKNISDDTMNRFVDEGKLYLFQIYNKDFSPYSKGTPNMHTLYWKALFSEKNMEERIYKLNGEAEIFYRQKSISENDVIVHKANEEIENKNINNEKKYSEFNYDIVKDKRFTVDKFQFHVPITMNFTAENKINVSRLIREEIKYGKDLHVIGIDRGERHLLYVTVVDMDGNIKEQHSLNKIVSNHTNLITDYHQLLDIKEKERLEARKDWKSVENIKELKEGYMSQVIHLVTTLMLKYNAIVALEDLNFGFKRGRQKVEKQVYQNFEKALINKLNYLIDKKAEEDEVCGVYHALQLTNKFESFQKLGKQSGALFYVPAWMTSKIDPTTGFVNMIYPKYESVEKSKEFIGKIHNIAFDKEGYYTFDIDYNDFTNKIEGTKTVWTLCSYGERILNKYDGTHWKNEEIDLTEEFRKLFNEYGITQTGSMKEAILHIKEKAFYSRFMNLFKAMLQMRNSITNGEIDYILSPVKNNKGEFFDSRYVSDDTLPKDADANGAYNIARKGLMIINKIKETPEDKLDKVNMAISNKEWLKFAQKNV